MYSSLSSWILFDSDRISEVNALVFAFDLICNNFIINILRKILRDCVYRICGDICSCHISFCLQHFYEI